MRTNNVNIYLWKFTMQLNVCRNSNALSNSMYGSSNMLYNATQLIILHYNISVSITVQCGVRKTYSTWTVNIATLKVQHFTNQIH